MRSLSLVALLVAAAPAFGQENEAEKLYRAMEKKIRTAKSVHFVFATELTGEGKKIEAKGTVHLAEKNKGRIELDMDVSGKMTKVMLVTDGKSKYSKFGEQVKIEEKPGKEGELDKVLGYVARFGMGSSFFVLSRKEDPDKKEVFDLDKEHPVKNFKLGAKEKVGQRTAQIVEYQIGLGEVMAKAMVWIDPKTDLPLKRVLEADKDGKQAFHVVETYSAFTVGGKLDAKLFEMPK
jgi:hypothetical protein